MDDDLTDDQVAYLHELAADRRKIWEAHAMNAEPAKAGDEIIADAIRAGCAAGDIHLECSYPTCTCKTTPKIVRAAIAEYRRGHAPADKRSED